MKFATKIFSFVCYGAMHHQAPPSICLYGQHWVVEKACTVSPRPFPLEQGRRKSPFFASRPEDAGDTLEESLSPLIERHAQSQDHHHSLRMESISAEYALLAQSQFKIIAGATGAERCALFFRKEHSQTGRLEFRAFAVHPENTRVWLVSSKTKCKNWMIAAWCGVEIVDTLSFINVVVPIETWVELTVAGLLLTWDILLALG